MTLTTRDLGDLSPSTAYRLAASGRLDPTEPYMVAILTAMDTRPGEVPPQGEHARQAGLPPRMFREAFIAATGMSWTRYLIEARMRVARALLAETERPVQVIGIAVGYQTKEAFSNAFHVEHGIWPTEYRRQVRP